VLSDRSVSGIAFVITGTWALLALFDAASASYQVPNSVHGIMGLVAGALFGERAVSSRMVKNDDRRAAD
jgi:hypothetical protein